MAIASRSCLLHRTCMYRKSFTEVVDTSVATSDVLSDISDVSATILMLNQCCHSVMNKNPRIYLEKKTENNKKNQTYQTFTKSQNRTCKARYRYLHIKIKVICIVCTIFLTSSSLFLNILTIYKKVSSESNEVT